MSETGTPIDRAPGPTLTRLIARYGRELPQDRERLEGLLRDECGSAHRREISVLIAAAEIGVPETITTRTAAVGWGVARSECTGRLTGDRGLAPDAAQWAVDAWATALGVQQTSSGWSPPELPKPPVDPVPVDSDARDVQYGIYGAIAWGVVMVWITMSGSAGIGQGSVLLSTLVIAAVAAAIVWGIRHRNRTAAGVFLALTTLGALGDLLPPKLPVLLVDLGLAYVAFRTARVLFDWKRGQRPAPDPTPR